MRYALYIVFYDAISPPEAMLRSLVAIRDLLWHYLAACGGAEKYRKTQYKTHLLYLKVNMIEDSIIYI